MTISYKEAQERYKREINALLETHKPFRMPTELWIDASNRLRAVAVAEMNGGTLTKSLCSQYGLPQSVVGELGFSVEPDEANEKRSDKYKAFEKWAGEHDSEQYTTAQLVEVAGFSYPTVLKFIDGSPYFRKIKNGLYECRNEEMRRKQAK